jgi:NADPH:quinone reductase-like Zn-dependent oxidoreductase
MKAVVWHGRRDVRVETVPDPTIVDPTDAIVRVTSSGLCGSDLHLYEVLAAFMTPGDVLGHEPMGIVEAVGPDVDKSKLKVGDRGTEVHVHIDYLPPGGAIGHWVASMLGENPSRVVREDVRRFKRLMETGEVPTIDGQTRGACR